MNDADVIVVGGGPAGASTAFALARAGANVIVVDRERFPRDKPCAEYLSPQASRVLHDMGVLSEIEGQHPAHLAGMIVRAPSGRQLRGDFVARHGYRGFRDRGLALRRRVLDAILLNAARHAGARIHERVRVTDVVRNGRGRVRGVRVIGHDGDREFCAPFVVGADGLRTVIGRRLGLVRSGRFPRRIALVSHWRGIDDVSEYGEMHVERDGYVGIAPVDGDLINVAVVIPASRAPAIGGDRARYQSDWLAGRRHLAGRFARAMRVSAVAATGPFNVRARRAWAPGALLVGDAADFFDPFTGEGIYAALRGGELAAAAALKELERTGYDEEALREYEQARRAEFSGKWRVERMVGAAVSLPALIERAADALSRRKDLADLFVGVTGDFVPPREVLRPSYLIALLFPSLAATRPEPPSPIPAHES